VEAIRAFTGKQPRGWETPGLTETFDAIDLLAAEGLEYVADWILDDQPVNIATSSGTIVSLPYTIEMNEVAISAVAQHSSNELLKRGIRQFGSPVSGKLRHSAHHVGELASVPDRRSASDWLPR
jgi:hypothetical protein